MEEHPCISFRTSDEAEAVLERLDHALLSTLVRHLEGLVQELYLGGPLELVPAVHSNDELDPITVFEGEVSHLQ